MFSHALAIVLLIAQSDGNLVDVTTDSAEVTKFSFDDMSFSGRIVRFSSEKGRRTCIVEGDAKMNFGDIAITADRIQLVGQPELQSLVCTGTCTWRQEDESGELYSADKLEFDKGGMRLAGNASLQYGSAAQKTVITCDAITTDQTGCRFSGNVRLKRGE